MSNSGLVKSVDINQVFGWRIIVREFYNFFHFQMTKKARHWNWALKSHKAIRLFTELQHLHSTLVQITSCGPIGPGRNFYL